MARSRLLCVAVIALLVVARIHAADSVPPDRATQLEEEVKRLRAELDFAQRRMALLDAEAERLRKIVQERTNATDLSADRARRTNIEHEVERLRGLHFLHPVDYHEIDRSELPTILRQKLAQQLPDQEFDHVAVAFGALGILRVGFDLRKAYLSLLGEQIGAFYDQHEQGLFTFSSHPLSVLTNRVIMAHELTHALEDQNFGLARLPIEARGNDDRALAATALVEGDATLVMNRYMTGDLSASALRDALGQALTTDVRQLAATPAFLRETLLFPYLRGQEFAQRVYDQGGWEALNEAFKNPPSSSAQILHPELYLKTPREEPVAIDFPNTTIDGAKPVEDNVLGEFGYRQWLIARFLDRARAGEAAAGWRGDRYLVYDESGATDCVVKIALRDCPAATKMYEALRVNYAGYLGIASGPTRTDTKEFGGEGIVKGWVFDANGHDFCEWMTTANEVIVIDAHDTPAANALRARFAPDLQIPRPW